MYLKPRFFYIIAGITLCFILGFPFPPLATAASWLLAALSLTTAADTALLWSRKNGASAWRICADRFSNGDDNNIRLEVENAYPFAINLAVTDEIPAVFGRRDILFRLSLRRGQRKDIVYSLRPVKRGEYDFGHIRLFVATGIGLAERRITTGNELTVKVYPSFMMLRQYELLAISNNLTEMGIKKIRRIGHHSEFEQIKEYVKDDDYRTINWKATARRNQLMVNTFRNERSQQVYNIIDKGRIMQSAFRGMTLLDYAINAALVLSFVAVLREDKAGLATFSSDFETFVPASKHSAQINLILENLYRQQTDFGESDYSSLYVHLEKHVSKRSLLVIYTDFENIIGMERQLDYLSRLARRHVVLVVFFENTELREVVENRPRTTEDYINQVVAEKFIAEKRHVVSVLKQHGVYSLLTAPEKLSINVINRYLEMKSRRLI